MRGSNEGILVIDPEPSFTIYRMRFTDSAGVRRDIAGVLGALEVVDLEAGGSPAARADHGRRPPPIAST